MTEREGGLPPQVRAVVERVLASAALEFTDGRDEVESELIAHFEDGLDAGTDAETLIRRFGDPEEAGRRIARTRPRAEARRRGERGRWWMVPTEWRTEVSRAARRLRRAPGFALVVVATLALGVGANTAIFTVLDAVLLEGLPYVEPDRLVRVYEAYEEDPGARWFLRAPVFGEYRTWSEVFESAGALYTYRAVGADLTDGDVPRRVAVTRASAGYFETLGIAPLRGRTFREEESFGPGEAASTSTPAVAVAVISHDLWTEHFGGDEALVGRTVRLDDAAFEVVGIMPPGFTDPFGQRSDVWVPQDLRPGGSNGFGNYYLSAVARLKDGVTLEAARERTRTLASAFAEREPDAVGSFPHLEPLHEEIVGSTRATMLWLLAAAGVLVLLTASLNVANLVLARGLGQDRPLALRSALGAGRGRLVAGILAENGLLAILGGVVGYGVGWLGIRGMARVAPDALPGIVDLEMGGRVFLFALAVTLGALVIFALLPAMRLSRTAPAEILRAGDRSATASRLARRVRDGLVVVQVAAALVLVTGAGLLARSFATLTEVPLAFSSDGVLTFEVNLPSARYPDGAQRQAFHQRLHQRLRDLPGVEAVGATSWLPATGRYHSWGFTWDSDPEDGADAPWTGTDVRVFAGDYFGALDIPVLRGAEPSEVRYEGDDVVWINRAIAESVFGDVDPIGQQIQLNGLRRVVGIVETVPYDVRGASSYKAYLPHAQYNDDRNWALIQTIRTRGDAERLVPEIRDALASLDGLLVLHGVRTLDQVLAGARAQDRFATVLMTAFAALALLLSVLGTYGVVAGSVAARTREFGIRMALGADAGQVRRAVLRYAGAITGIGIVLGLVMAWGASRWLESLLFQVDPRSPVAYAAAVALFLTVGTVAAWVPARRATRVDTVEVLAAE